MMIPIQFLIPAKNGITTTLANAVVCRLVSRLSFFSEKCSPHPSKSCATTFCFHRLLHLLIERGAVLASSCNTHTVRDLHNDPFAACIAERVGNVGITIVEQVPGDIDDITERQIEISEQNKIFFRVGVETQNCFLTCRRVVISHGI